MLALRRKPPFEAGLPDPARTHSAASRASALSAILALVRAWRERARCRWELSQMSAGDFADLGVPRNLAERETRRWPWQGWDSQWQEIENTRHRAAQAEPPVSPPNRSITGGAATFLTLAAAWLTITLFALTPITTRLATAEIDGIAVGVFRTVGAAAFAIPILALFRLAPPRSRAGWRLLTVSMVGGFIGFPLLFSAGTQLTSGCHAALIMASIPLFTGLIGTAVERRVPRPLWLAGVAIALIGEVALIASTTGWAGSGAQGSLFGDLLVLAACLAVASGFVAGARLTAQIGAWAATFWAIALAGIALAPIAAVEAHGMAWTHLSPLSWMALLHLALGAGVVGFAAWFFALARGGIARIAVLQFFQPLISLALAVVLLAEHLTAVMTVAAVVVLTGVLIARHGESGRRAALALAQTGR